MLGAVVALGTISECEQMFRRMPKPPPVDVSRHCVPLSEVFFYDFITGYCPLSELHRATVELFLDSISPIYDPLYEPAESCQWLDPEKDLVIGYEAGDRSAYAYPLRILRRHEIVNDTIANTPVLVTYCPLSASGAVYSRLVDNTVLTFGNTGARYQSGLIMYDYDSGSYWYQMNGRAIIGRLTGARLELLPSRLATYGEWLDSHPNTLVLSNNQSAGRDPYGVKPGPDETYSAQISQGTFPAPVSLERVKNCGAKLPLGERVMVVRVGDAQKAYVLRHLWGKGINDVVNGEPVLVMGGRSACTAAAFSRLLGGRPLTFSMVDGTLMDMETGSSWDAYGRAVAGRLRISRLRPLPTIYCLWFAAAVAIPDLQVCTGEPS